MARMGIKFAHVDAFTDKPFRGNPAAVCILSGPRSEQWMQKVAREMNLSETAFLHRHADGFNLRWFSPTIEVDLCGHATLASAHLLKEEGYLKPDKPVRFYTRSGVLTASQNEERIELDFPAEAEEETPAPVGLAEALGMLDTMPRYVGRNRFDYLVEVDSEKTLLAIKPDFTLLTTLPTRGVIVTSRAGLSQYDFASRVFAPRIGINEDPVTGSAHCCLGPFWSSRLQKTELIGYQASERGGAVHMRTNGNRIYLGGKAVTVLKGMLL
jgi:PhzF family phenazine biosynthesis protein